MKKIVFIALTHVFVFIGNAQNLTFQAEIANRKGDTIKILNSSNGKEVKKMGIDKKGLFNDAFAVEEGIYFLFDGKDYAPMFLKNGYDLKLKMDALKFYESIVYSGIGAEENNLLAQSTFSDSKYDYNSLLASSEEVFTKLVKEKTAADFLKLDDIKLNPNFVALQKKNIGTNMANLTAYYKKTQENKKLSGSVAQTFDYVNHKGGNTKLEDLRGKYVYIDVWATWCGPCRGEIPFLKKMEEEFHDKNIAFVSISVDLDKDFEKWKNFVTEKQLGGIQLFADKNWNSDFIKSFSINSIPRFILIDPNGKVVHSDALRPSNPELKEELGKLVQ